ncbi:MAG TPA: amidohydrolase family protein [Mycobacteriales bacterium]|nr:amidohydrolase family protein [Mycobacteriales bacterium]
MAGDLVDHHVHGVVATSLERDQFELLANEGGRPAPAGTSHFDTPVGLAILTGCGPLLDLAPDCTPERYLEARAALGAVEVNRRLLAAAGLDALLVETGHRPGDVLDPAAMGRLAGATAHEVVRIERAAEDHARGCDGPDDFLAGLGAALDAAASAAVGLKSVVAYRHGFDLAVEPPDHEGVRRATEAWFREFGAATAPRLAAPVLLAHVLHAAIEVAASRRLPVQVHAGFGDTDLTMHRADPSQFTPWVRELEGRGVDVVFLHCYPYHRQAGYLANVFPNVYFDVGCMAHYTGPSAGTVIAEALELAPYPKQLYSSDGFGLAEFVYLGAVLFRRHLDRVLDGWVDAGDCPRASADRIRELIGAGNARRLYRLDDEEPR